MTLALRASGAGIPGSCQPRLAYHAAPMPRVLGIAVALLLAMTASATAAPLVSVTADPHRLGPRVPQSFVGFSDEYTVVPRHLTPQVAQLFEDLAAYGGGPPVYRLGGGSTDSSWFAPVRPQRPRGAYYGITSGYLAALRDFVTRTGSPLVLGLNLGLDRPSLAGEWATAAENHLPSIKAFELGNEPDIFFERVLNGVTPRAYMRSRRWDAADYVRDLRRFMRRLRPLHLKAPVGAPGMCCKPKFLRYLPQIVRDQRRDLGLITLHQYPLLSCDAKPGSRDYPTPAKLLAPGALVRPVKLLSDAVSVGRRYHLKVRLTETNSVACGGAVGTSDVFGSALWSADWYFTLAALGLDGADIHTSNPTYAPFRTIAGQTAVGPVYYGLLLFAETVGHGGRMIPSTYFGVRERRGANVKVWGVRDAAKHQVRVAVINKTGPGGTVTLRVPGARGAGTLKLLAAPSLRSRRGITWGGQRFLVPTPDGKLSGPLVVHRVARRAGGTYRIRVRRHTAALLTVHR